jgi:DNA-binding PadR family transcriptional regulator
LLLSEWNVEGSRPRRYYQLSPAGAEVLRGLSKGWWHLVDTMAGLLETKEGKK